MKENTSTKILNLDKLVKEEAVKPKSLRPMRSMVAVRSLKPKTAVATFVTKSEKTLEANQN